MISMTHTNSGNVNNVLISVLFLSNLLTHEVPIMGTNFTSFQTAINYLYRYNEDGLG